jgi:hypothetical protein
MTMLSGKVAIVAEGAVREVRDLGPDDVEVKPGVLPVVEVLPELADGETLGPPAYAIEETRVVATYEALPVPRRKVARALIVDRLIAAGLLTAARAALDAAPLAVQERWNARTEIYADDPDALALLNGIGADADAVMAPIEELT